MRRFVVLMVTEIEFVEESESIVQSCEENLAKAVREAGQNLTLRAISDVKVEKVQVAEIQRVLSL